MLRGLAGPARARLAAQAEAVAAPAGEWLFRQGDAGDALYVVRSGRLEAVREAPEPPVVLRELGRGALVGELAFLTGEPRSASVRAVRDSELLRIPRGAVEALLEDSRFSAALLAALGRQLAASGALASAAGPAAPRTVAVVAAAPGAPVRRVADVVAATVRAPSAVLDGAGLDPDAFGPALDAAEAAGPVVLVSDGPAEDPWAGFCLRQADRALVLAPGGSPPPRVAPGLRGRDLALCFPVHAADAAPWLDALAPRARHLIRPGGPFAADAARAARRVAGRSVGVVLSGGGARGLAHLGVLAELADAGIAVDRLGGASMGAFVAGLSAIVTDPREAVAICRAELVARSPFRSYGMPRAALLRPAPVEAMLGRVFAQRSFEELALDAFAVSADLVAAEVVVHRRGRMRDAVRASLSVPGWLPPVPAGRRLLVDGGVLDNLPVDVMAAAGEGPVVAVDVMGRGLADPGRLPERLPNAVDTVARATVLGSWRAADANRQAAALVIAPDLGAAGIRDFGRLDDLVQAGRRAARHALAEGGAALEA